MITLAFDPGPTDAAWAVVDLEHNDVPAFGTAEFPVDRNPAEVEEAMMDVALLDKPDLVAIEAVFAPVKSDKKMRVEHVIETAKTVGLLWYLVQRIWPGIPVIEVSRMTMKAALPGGRQDWKDKQVNHCMAQLIPKLQAKQLGLNQHTRAAAAIGYVAPGVFTMQQLKARF